MTETLSTSTPEQARRNLTGVPEGLRPDTLDDLVNYRVEIDRQYDAQDDVRDYRAFKAQKLDELLAENGIFDDESDEKKHADYEFAKNVYQEVINTRSADWYGVREGETIDRRAEVLGELRDHYSDAEREPSTAHDNDDEGATQNPERSEQTKQTERSDLSDEEKAEADKALTEIADKYAKLVAERSKSMIEGANTRKDIDASKEGLSDLLAGLATLKMDELEAAGISWDNIPGEIDKFIAEQTDSVLAKMEAHRMEEYNNARPIMKKFYDKWARYGEQGFKGKVKKAAWFALPGAALGAALVPLAGAVGFGAIGGAIAVTGGRSIGRNLAGAHLDKRANAKKIAEEQTADIKSRIDAKSKESVAESDRPELDEKGNSVGPGKNLDILEVIDERSDAYRKRNLRRTAGGLAIALTAGLLTAKAVDIVGDNVDNWWFGKLGDLGDGKPDIDGPDVDGDEPDIRDRDGDVPDGPGGPDGPGPNGDLSRDELFDGRFGTRDLTAEGHEALSERYDGYHVKSGDSVWSLSEQFLNEQGIQNPTVYEIDATKDVLLSELRATGSVDGRGWLLAGDTIHIK